MTILDFASEFSRRILGMFVNPSTSGGVVSSRNKVHVCWVVTRLVDLPKVVREVNHVCRIEHVQCHVVEHVSMLKIVRNPEGES